ncbi:hypothetical protein [Thermoactinospora rubra]|uniref:hypothetical protein n=1 Tax=Thermoactinospora rubra TaxID=1088767 RepID=UPI001F0AB5C9|nr:hypothetical protein [Thermoactinospora rubra]
MRERCRTLLGQEDIRYVFPALSTGPPGMAGFLVVVTDRAVHVLATRTLRSDRPTSVYASHPRATRLGPILYGTGPLIELGSLVLEFDEEYAAVVNAADAEVFAPETLPPDPLPDL